MFRRFLRSIYQMLAENVETGSKRAAEETAPTAGPPAKMERKAKSVKYAMLLAYQGQNYFGMQIQRDVRFPTVENHLLDEMIRHGFITERHKEDPFSWHFQRAARTDRTVSAVRQVCSMHLPLDPHFIENGASLLNSSLPDDIRVFSIRRVTPSFHAQKYCDGRTYSYTLPTFAFAPCDQLTTDAYRITDERIAELKELLGCFVGTHNFYNYTSKLEHSDQRSKRTIHEIRCDKPFLYTDPVRGKEVEFMSVYIKGQSFMLHQIRKMIGVVLAILRGFMFRSDITRSFQADRLDIPRAPGLGLLLERLHYDRFENRFQKTHGSLNDWGPEIERQMVEWRDRMIVERILSDECRTNSMMQWLGTLPLHRYLLDPEDESDQNISQLREAACNAAAVLNPENPESGQVDDETVEEGDGVEDGAGDEQSETTECKAKEVKLEELAAMKQEMAAAKEEEEVAEQKKKVAAVN